MPPEPLDGLTGARLIFFGGKGGVGKTTVAAAAALRLARAERSRAVLLLSTDPAHSLADVFGQRIGDRPTKIRLAPSNLRVRELDARAALAARRGDLEAALNEISAAVGAEDVAGPGRGVNELLDLAPPGIDELFGLLEIMRLAAPERRGPQRAVYARWGARAGAGPREPALARGGGAPRAYEKVIVDTAPTGHALRLLELPEAAREWVQVLMHVLLKYRSLVRPGRLAAELVTVSREIRELQTLLRDARDTRFIVVTRAAEVPLAETDRLLARLRRLHLATPAVIVNAMTLAPGACPRCRATASAERRLLAGLARRCRRRPRDCAIIQTPLVAPPPRGVRALDRWAGGWISEGQRAKG